LKTHNLGVSKNSGIPKWMVKIMENPIKMDDLGGKPTIFGNIHFQPTQLNGGPSQVLDRSVDVLSLSPTAGARFNPLWVGKFYPRVFFGGRKNWKPQKHHVLFKDHFFLVGFKFETRFMLQKQSCERIFFTPQKHILKQASLAQKEAQKIN